MTKVRRGTVREDGKVFFRFQKLAGKTYEVWLLPEAYKVYCDKQKAILLSRGEKVPLSSAPEDRAKRSARHRRWRNETPLRRLARNVRSRVREVLSENKTRASLKYVGCSLPDLKRHLEQQFTPGMNWTNYGDWHVDHRVPLASAATLAALVELLHFSNLQPLWARDNISKGAHMPDAVG